MSYRMSFLGNLLGYVIFMHSRMGTSVTPPPRWSAWPSPSQVLWNPHSAQRGHSPESDSSELEEATQAMAASRLDDSMDTGGAGVPLQTQLPAMQQESGPSATPGMGSSAAWSPPAPSAVHRQVAPGPIPWAPGQLLPVPEHPRRNVRLQFWRCRSSPTSDKDGEKFAQYCREHAQKFATTMEMSSASAAEHIPVLTTYATQTNHIQTENLTLRVARLERFFWRPRRTSCMRTTPEKHGKSPRTTMATIGNQHWRTLLPGVAICWLQINKPAA